MRVFTPPKRLPLPICTLLASLVVMAHAPTSHAAPLPASAVCGPTSQIDKYQLLRQLSLDLRGRIPSFEEYTALDSLETVSPELLAPMLEGDDFLAQVRRYHASLILPTLEGVDYLVPLLRRLELLDADTPQQRYWARFAGFLYRGFYELSCLDQEQTEFDADGRPVPIVTDATLATGCPDTGCTQEGWVWVEPYWAPGTQVKVCAYEAQQHALGSSLDIPFYGTIGPIDCSGPSGFRDPKCGCGPNLARCSTLDLRNVVDAFLNSDFEMLGTDIRLRSELAEEPLRIMEAVVREGRPYFDSLTTDETYLTGATTHFYRHMHAQGSGDDILRETPYDARMGSLPSVPFDSQAWTRHQRNPEHSGILTTFGYMLRHNSNRGRANVYYDRFLCRPFQAPAGGLPPSTDPCSAEPDLTKRCGCATCHTTLEPAAAFFGRWKHTQRFGYMSVSAFPDSDSACAGCQGPTCSAECSLYYVTPDKTPTAAEDAWHGQLMALQWRSKSEAESLLAGPEDLVVQGLATGDLARCTVRNLAEHLLKRELRADELLEWVPQLAAGFAQNNYDFKGLVRTLVESEAYRRIE